MSFGFQIKDNTVWASISGEVDMQIASLWREALEQQLNSTLARNLTFDFTGVRFIDSSGLGVVLGRYKRVASRGGCGLLALARRFTKFCSYPALPA